jgi:hypothetical protein
MSASACVTVSRSPTRSRGIARQSSTHADADDTASGAHGHSSAREALRVARARRVRSHVARRASRRVAARTSPARDDDDDAGSLVVEPDFILVARRAATRFRQGRWRRAGAREVPRKARADVPSPDETAGA